MFVHFLDLIQAIVMATVALAPALTVMLMALVAMSFSLAHTSMVVLFGRKVEIEEEEYDTLLLLDTAKYEEGSWVMEGFVREPSTAYQIGRIVVNATNLAVLSVALPVTWVAALPGRAATAWVAEADRWVIWPIQNQVELALTRTVLVI